MAWLALIAGTGLQAVITALLGLSLTAADSLLMLVLAASACMLVGAVAARRNRSSPIRHPQSLRAVLWMNAWTALSFVAFFLGVAVHSAGVVVTLEASFAPLAVTAWTAFCAHRGDDQARSGAAQRWAAAMLAVLGTSLVIVMAQSEPGGMIALLSAAVLGVIAGVAAGAVVVISRGLGRSGVGVARVMTHRFYATIVLAAAALLTLVPCGQLAPPVLPVELLVPAALTSVAAPMFMLQYATQWLTPVSVTAALATMPAITIAIELGSGRPVSWIVLFLGMLIVPANLVLLLAQQQKRTLPQRPASRTTLFGIEHRTATTV